MLSSNPKSGRLARQWDACRFKLSCLLYKSPVLLPASVLSVGVVLGGLMGLSAFFVLPISPNGDDVASQSPTAQASQEIQMRALSAQLSVLDAQANRLDALGQQWVQRMNLEDESFDFSAPPAQGSGSDDAFSSDHGLSPQLLASDIQGLSNRYERLDVQLKVLDRLSHLGERFPEEVPHASPGYGHMTSNFGLRHDPFGRGRRFHAGIDLSARMGDPVMSMAEGVVVFSGTQGAYGRMIEVDHGNGYRTRYGHNSQLVARVGDRVQVGQILAKAGSTGRSTGVHLHVEVWKNGQAVNPRPFLERGRELLAQRQQALAALADLPATPTLLDQDTATWVSVSPASHPRMPKG